MKQDKPTPVPIPNPWPDPCDFGGVDVLFGYFVYRLFRRLRCRLNTYRSLVSR